MYSFFDSAHKLYTESKSLHVPVHILNRMYRTLEERSVDVIDETLNIIVNDINKDLFKVWSARSTMMNAVNENFTTFHDTWQVYYSTYDQDIMRVIKVFFHSGLYKKVNRKSELTILERFTTMYDSEYLDKLFHEIESLTIDDVVRVTNMDKETILRHFFSIDCRELLSQHNRKKIERICSISPNSTVCVNLDVFDEIFNHFGLYDEFGSINKFIGAK